MKDIELDKRYWIAEVARLLDVHMSTVVRWATLGLSRRKKQRKLKTHKVGGRRACLGRDLVEFLEVEADIEDLGLRSSSLRRQSSETAARELEQHGA